MSSSSLDAGNQFEVRSPLDGTQRVVVIGQGYVGLPLAMRAVEKGFDVVGFDVDTARISRLTARESFVEDVSTTTLRAAFETGRYQVSTSRFACRNFDIAVITVPTPLRQSAPDLSYIEFAAKDLGPYVRRGSTIILESTTYPGTTEESLIPILEQASGLKAGADFHVGYSPERIDPGNPTWQFHNTPKVVSGIDARSLELVSAFYGALVERIVPVSSCKEAELTKLLENTFRHVNVALVNELAMFAKDLGIDVWESIDAAATKPFGFMKFTPGPGVGGHCLPIDPSYLSWSVKQHLGKNFRFVDLANDVNEHMPDFVAQRLMLLLNESSRALKGARVLLLGLTYKPNSSDARESPAVIVAQRLVGLGAEVRAVEPFLHGTPPQGVTLADLTASEIEASDAVVVLTNHACFDLELVTQHASLVFDCRHACQPADNVVYL